MTTKNSIPSIPKSDPSDKSDPSVSTLESLVPPLDLCRKIPPGEFEDTALIWFFCGSWFVNAREFDAQSDEEFPAPTLQEILAEFNPPKYHGLQMVKLRSGVWQVLVCKDILISKGVTQILCYGEDYSPATAALKLWLELNSIPSIPSIPTPEVKP